ncbi:MAG: hypothetical protein AAGD32_11025 [Planctomycetota bacterium]
MPTRRKFLAATAAALVLPRFSLAAAPTEQVAALRIFGHAGGKPLQALAASAGAGVRGTTLTLHWDELGRNADGGYDGTNGIDGLAQLCRNAGIQPALEIPVIDEATMRVPGEFEQAPLPRMVAEFGKLIEHLAETLGYQPPVVILGKSVDRYLRVNDEGWRNMTAFVREVAPMIRTAWPDAKVSVAGTFEGVNGAHRKRFAELWKPCDLALVSYLPLWDTAMMKPGRQVERDLRRIPALAGMPCGIHDVACPSGTVCGSSEQAQADFIDLLANVCRGSDALRWVQLAWYQDLPPGIAKGLAGTLGSDLAAFADAIATLGLHHANGVAKPAWERLVG